jgi:hypothetical protein
METTKIFKDMKLQEKRAKEPQILTDGLTVMQNFLGQLDRMA